MYNRYFSDKSTMQDDFIEVESSPVAEAGAIRMPSHGHADKPQTSLLESGRSLLRNLHIPELTFDDLLLIGIIILLLRESDDDDIIIILAALFFTGFFKDGASVA